MTAKTYDQRCYDLAKVFLESEGDLDTEVRRDELAKLIQSAVEDYIFSEHEEWNSANGRFGVGA